MEAFSLRSAIQRLQSGQIIPVLIVSLISGLVVTTYQISFGSLIFNGYLSPYLSNGIGFCLMGVVMIASIEAVLSGNPGMVAIPTVASAVIVASIAGNLANALAGQTERIFPTVIAGITISSLLTGVVFIILGWFGLGNLIRFIPYPVIGGFLAGTGWLVFRGALKSMNGIALDWNSLPKFLETGALIRWLPGFALGVAILWISRKIKHYLVIPVIILTSIGTFFLILHLTNTTIPEAVKLGLLFEPFTPGSLWSLPPVQDLVLVDWGVILSQFGEIATLILISSITVLLYASGIEVTAGTEVNLNRELSACGLANLAAGFSASIPGYTIITMSVLSHRLGARSRMVGILVALICASFLFWGAGLIAFFPKPVLGAVLSYLGLTFLVDWLVMGVKRLSSLDYMIVVIIMIVMSSLGLLPGLATGIALAAGLFIVQYSQTPVVRHVLNGRTYQSRVTRSMPDLELIRQKGQALSIMEMQGFVFFGTANRVYEDIKTRLQDTHIEKLKMLILDFRQVNGIDASAALCFVRLKRLLRQNHVRLVFTSLKPQVEKVLRRDVLTSSDQDLWRVFPELDLGVEWFETQILETASTSLDQIQLQPGVAQPGIQAGGLAILFTTFRDELKTLSDSTEDALLKFLETLKPIELDAGQVIIHQGEPQDKLYFLDSGELLISYQISSNAEQIRMGAGGPGMIVGELGFYLGVPASATVSATKPGVVFSLSIEELADLERDNPAIAAILHRFLLKRISRQLLSAMETIDMLMA